MPSGLYIWSQTANANASADSAINYQEGQAPSSVNDSARAVMAVVAKYRDDISGAIVTGGTSTNYTLTSYSIFDTLPHMNGQMIAFTPHTANGATVTLNVDGLGAKPLRVSPNVELQSNVLIQGTPYVATYNNSDGAFYLHNLASNTYGVPLGAGMDFWLPTAPSSAFAFPTGQAISRTTYATLFAAMGTTYGTGDGSTTFNLPDKTGRVSAMKEASATRLTAAGSGINGATMGASGGAETKTLLIANLPPYTPAGTIANGAITISDPNVPIAAAFTGNNNGGGGGSFGVIQGGPAPITASQAASTFTGTAQGGTSAPVATIPPLIVCNYILRII